MRGSAVGADGRHGVGRSARRLAVATDGEKIKKGSARTIGGRRAARTVGGLQAADGGRHGRSAGAGGRHGRSAR